jgi:hypothetical protein
MPWVPKVDAVQECIIGPSHSILRVFAPEWQPDASRRPRSILSFAAPDAIDSRNRSSSEVW